MLKILIVKNRLTVEVSDDIQKAFAYLESRTPLKFELSYLETSLDVQYKAFNVNGFYGTTGTKDKLSPLITQKYDIVIFLYGNSSDGLTPDGKQLTSWTLWETLNGMEYIEIPAYPLGDTTDWIDQTLSHEMMHAMLNFVRRKGVNIVDEMDLTNVNGTVVSYYKNNDRNALDGNYAHTIANLSPYWNLFVPQSTSVYMWFSPAEVAKWKLKPELWQALDKMREIASTSFVITSGLRTPQENANVGGKPNSAHLRGIAVDLLCTDNVKRTKMIKGILGSGIPCFLEIAKSHLHIDLDPSIHTLGQTIVSEDE